MPSWPRISAAGPGKIGRSQRSTICARNWRPGGTNRKSSGSATKLKLAAVELREWTGDKVYARLFDRPTTIRTDENWLFFNVEGLTSDPKLESSMSMIIANSMSERASGRSGQANITVLDECWSLLDSAVLAP